MTTHLFQMEKLTRDERERIFWAILTVIGRPQSYLDIGCGDGWLVRAARQVGCQPAFGIGTEKDRAAGRKWSVILIRDIQLPFQLDRQFALVTCFVRAYWWNILAHVAPGGRIVVASPEMGGPNVSPHGAIAFDSEETFRLNQALDSTAFEVYKCV